MPPFLLVRSHTQTYHASLYEINSQIQSEVLEWIIRELPHDIQY
jgi:hypothetical protein